MGPYSNCLLMLHSTVIWIVVSYYSTRTRIIPGDITRPAVIAKHELCHTPRTSTFINKNTPCVHSQFTVKKVTFIGTDSTVDSKMEKQI